MWSTIIFWMNLCTPYLGIWFHTEICISLTHSVQGSGNFGSQSRSFNQTSADEIGWLLHAHIENKHTCIKNWFLLLSFKIHIGICVISSQTLSIIQFFCLCNRAWWRHVYRQYNYAINESDTGKPQSQVAAHQLLTHTCQLISNKQFGNRYM